MTTTPGISRNLTDDEAVDLQRQFSSVKSRIMAVQCDLAVLLIQIRDTGFAGDENVFFEYGDGANDNLKELRGVLTEWMKALDSFQRAKLRDKD